MSQRLKYGGANDMTRNFNIASIILTAAFVMAAPNVHAETHYVAPDGTSSWAESSDRDSPCSLFTANTSARGGDTVCLLGGVYNAYISPVRDGGEGTPLTYMSAEGKQAVIRGTDYAIHLQRRSHIVVSGIAFENCRQFLIVVNGHHNSIIDCSFDRNRGEDVWMGSWVHDSSTYNSIVGCTFSHFGWVLEGDDKGVLLDIGYDTSTTDATNYNVVENCLFRYSGHHSLHICGAYNVVRGCYFHNEDWMDGENGEKNGNRNLLCIGPMVHRNLFEDNRFAFAGKPPDDNGANGLVLRCPDNIARRNMSYANGAGGIAFASMTVSIPTNNHVYFNTLYHNGYEDRIDHFWQAGLAFGNWGNGTMPGNIIINNIMYGNRNGKSIGGYGDPGPQTIEYNWLDSDSDPAFLDNTIPADTEDSTLPDFRLAANSPCIDKGRFLTTITSENGRGTVFTVEDAGYFFDGWTIPGETGDTVQLEGGTERAVIQSIDYGMNTITLDRPLAWKQGQGLSLTYEGNAPDPGAFEYGATDVGVKNRSVLPTGTPP